MRIHHVAVLTRDLERSIRFYADRFGFQLTERGRHDGAALAFLRLPGDGALLELVQDDDANTEGVVSHFALAVSDLPAEIARLRAAGVHLLDQAPVAIYNDGAIAFAEGPDGELIELHQPAKRQEIWRQKKPTGSPLFYKKGRSS